MTVESIKAALNKQAPKIDPKGIKAVVLESLDPAIIAVITSGAPFAKARKVTPANVGDISIS
jgi:hypothetical protein